MSGLKIYGIVAAQNPDNEGETLVVDGTDISKLNLIKDEHDKDNMFHSVGSINYAKKIFSERDCENDKQLRCWNYAKVPLIYGEGELANYTEHPNAKAAASMIEFSQRSDIPLDVGFSVDGHVMERQDRSGRVTEDKDEGKTLSKTIALAASLTVKRCNPKCKLFMENDLRKSIACAAVPQRVMDLIKVKPTTPSFREVDINGQVALKLYKLHKSLKDYHGAFTSLKCYKCSSGVRFFKSSTDLPNMCSHCGSSFSMKEIWQALNK